MEQERKCDALTTKGRRCRKKAELYRQYQGREYLTCKQHDLYFRPHPIIAMKMEAIANECK